MDKAMSRCSLFNSKGKQRIKENKFTFSKIGAGKENIVADLMLWGMICLMKEKCRL